MTDILCKLKDIIGEQRLKEITIEGEDEIESRNDDRSVNLINAKEISCECKTLILRPKHATLIVPSDSMLEIEKRLSFLQHSDKFFKNLVRGCYWLVDDMYKFEQISYTKEIKVENQAKSSHTQGQQDGQQQSQTTSKFQLSGEGDTSLVLNGLRYLACAECNLCPLGWFDPKTKESYLYVW